MTYSLHLDTRECPTSIMGKVVRAGYDQPTTELERANQAEASEDWRAIQGLGIAPQVAASAAVVEVAPAEN